MAGHLISCTYNPAKLLGFSFVVQGEIDFYRVLIIIKGYRNWELIIIIITTIHQMLTMCQKLSQVVLDNIFFAHISYTVLSATQEGKYIVFPVSKMRELKPTDSRTNLGCSISQFQSTGSLYALTPPPLSLHLLSLPLLHSLSLFSPSLLLVFLFSFPPSLLR